MFCSVCGSPIENGDIFCSCCGSRVAANGSVQREPEVHNTTFESQSAYDTSYLQSTFRPTPVSDAEYKEKRGIAIFAMVMGIISVDVPFFVAIIFSLIAKKKLKKLKGYKPLYGNGFVIAAKATSTVGFIYGIVSTAILGLVYVLPTLIWFIYIAVMIVGAIIIAIFGGMGLI